MSEARLAWEWVRRATGLSAEEQNRLLRDAPLDDETRRLVAGVLERDHSGATFLATPRLAAEARLEDTPPTAIGPFRIERRIGRGGTSTVFLGEDAAGRRAAVKILRFGLDSPELRRRFLAEQEILSGVAHPGIARFLGAGWSQEGLPWLATELVEGLPITTHCDEARLPLRARLELFVTVCDAVRYAHAQLVVHRDLKPSNVLVDGAGRPRLLDFGIAKLLAGRSDDTTASLERILTVNYASPEHIAGERVGTSSDVYSLGVLLCELLCGARPWDWTDVPRQEVLRVLAQTVAPRLGRLLPDDSAPSVADSRRTSPEALRRQLRGDLDAIVAKAIRGEPDRRHRSVEELAEDIRRYLDGLPVLARSPGPVYRSLKALRRNLLASSVAALTLLGLASFAAISRYQLLRVREERVATEAARRAAEASRAEADSVTGILVKSFEAATHPGSIGGVVAAREILDRGVDEANALSSHAELQASLRDALGSAYLRLGLLAESRRELDLALSSRNELLGRDHPDTVRTLLASVEALTLAGDFEEAERRARRAWRARRRLRGDGDRETAVAGAAVARVLVRVGRYGDAKAFLDSAVATHRRSAAQAELADDLELLGELLSRTGRHSEAESALHESVALWQRLRGPDDVEVAHAQVWLASTLASQERFDAATALYEHACAVLERELGPQQMSTASCRVDQGILLLMRGGDVSRAEVLFERARPVLEGSLGGNNQALATLDSVLSNVALQEGNLPRAEALARKALAFYRRALPAHQERAYAAVNLANVLQQEGAWREAGALIEEALGIFRAALGARHASVARMEYRLAWVRWNEGDEVAAERLYRAALALLRQQVGPRDSECGDILAHLAWLLRRRGDLAQSEQLARQAIAIKAAVFGNRHEDTAITRWQLAATLAVQGDGRRALVESEEALAAYRGQLPETQKRIALARLVRGLARATIGDEAGLEEASQAHAVVRRTFRPSSLARREADELLALARRRLQLDPP